MFKGVPSGDPASRWLTGVSLTQCEASMFENQAMTAQKRLSVSKITDSAKSGERELGGPPKAFEPTSGWQIASPLPAPG